MTTNQYAQMAGIIEMLQAAVERLEDSPGVGLVRMALTQAEDLYWEAAEDERWEGMAA